jgi:BioD-like phosphotransacetylase family protein
MSIQQAINKSLKKNYSELNYKQKKLVKLQEKYNQAHKYLYGYLGFYNKVKRLSNRQVDWESLTNQELQIFENANKTIEKYNKVDANEIQNALKLFNQTQFTYSQSF